MRFQTLSNLMPVKLYTTQVSRCKMSASVTDGTLSCLGGPQAPGGKKRRYGKSRFTPSGGTP